MTNNIKLYCIWVLAILLIFATKQYLDAITANRMISNNLYHKEQQWTDEKGRLVTEVQELQFTTSELRSMHSADSTKLSDTQKQLYTAAKEIESLGIKLKDAISYNSSHISVDNSGLVTTIDKDDNGAIIALNPIKTKHLQIDFEVKSDTILVNHKYETDVTTVVNRKENKYTYSGKKRFFLARWINPRYEYWSTNVADDPDAKITSSVYLNFGNYNK